VQTRFSRRAFLIAAGGGLASASLLWSCGRSRTDYSRSAEAGVFESYVDHEGWMLALSDEKIVLTQPAATSGAR